jgi:predicted enzyme related to lactoylglutathione lyase
LFADVPASALDAAAGFWSAVSGWPSGEPSGRDGEFLPLQPAGGDRFLWLQRVDRPAGAGGWHLDLHVPDRAAGVEVAVTAGAEVVRTGDDYVALNSPAGLPFCLAREDDDRARTRPTPASRPGGRSLVDQICIDIPAKGFEREVAFWVRLTGWPQTGSDLPEFDRLAVPARLPVRMLLQRLGPDDTDGIRAHADIAADDRAAEVGRHAELGGEVVGPGQGWTTLRDPAGLTYCVTDRVPR